jgi:anthranilate synthase component 1
MNTRTIGDKAMVKLIHGDRFTPFSLCNKLGAKALLESASFEQGRGRYSILLVREAFSVFETKEGLFIRKDGRDSPLESTGRDILDRLLAFADQHAGTDHGFPYPAGGIGYLAYDYALRFDDIKAETKPDFLGVPDAYFIFGHVYLIFDHYTDTISILGLNYDEHRIDLARAIAETEERINDLDFNYLIRPSVSYEAALLAKDGDRERFLDGVERMRKEIIKGNLLQGVLSRRACVRSEIPAIEAYRRLRSLNPSPYMFYLDMGEFQLFGASPEIHVKTDGEKVVIRPLAGTRRRGKTHGEDRALEAELLADVKEKAEHLMLVDLARNDLGRVSRAGSVRVSGSMDIERYAYVMHLVSQVEGELAPGMSGIDAIRATFPAGTVSGAPKIRAMEIISALEKEKRGFYAGLVGYIEPGGTLDTCITIRSALKNDDILVLQAGAGIVYDSIPEREYVETSAKLEAMSRALGVEV